MPNPYEARLLRVVDYIHANLDGDLSLDALADVAAMSRFHWHRIWTAMTGETLAQTTRRIRLYRASVALVQSEQSLAEVARASGYPSQASFTRAFRASFGVTPGAYRTRGQAMARLQLPKIGESPMYPVKITHEQPRRVAGIAHTGDYQKISRAFETASATMAGRSEFDRVRGMVGVYYDDARNVPEPELRSYAGFIMGDDAPILGPFDEIDLPGDDHAVLTFTGPYTGLQKAYDYLFGTWLAQSGRELRESPCWELYLNTPMDTAPDDLVTEIYAPLKPA